MTKPGTTNSNLMVYPNEQIPTGQWMHMTQDPSQFLWLRVCVCVCVCVTTSMPWQSQQMALSPFWITTWINLFLDPHQPLLPRSFGPSPSTHKFCLVASSVAVCPWCRSWRKPAEPPFSRAGAFRSHSHGGSPLSLGGLWVKIPFKIGWLVGGCIPTPLKNMNVSWDD